MKRMMITTTALCLLMASGCDIEATPKPTSDVQKTKAIALRLEQRQPTPTDIDYSLERFNLMRRAYWVNGMREHSR